MSSFFPVNMDVNQACVLAPSFFTTCMDWVLGKVVDQSHCGASVGNTEGTDLVFAMIQKSLLNKEGFGNSSRSTARGGEARGTSGFLAQDQGSGAYRLTG